MDAKVILGMKLTPDPEMVAGSEALLGRFIPDMFLYHNEDTHYDLLVKSVSRLALLGLLAGATDKTERHI